jgi:hypothetical protein
MSRFSLGFATVVAGLWLGAVGIGQPAQPEPATGIATVMAYAGTWSIQTEHFDTANSKAGHEKATLRNDCWKSGGYVACNQYVDGQSKTLLVFTYNAKENVYNSYPIPLEGGLAGSGTLLIEGNTWTFPWQSGEGDKTTYFRVVNVFAGHDRIEFRQEFSADKTHWTLMAKGLEARIKDGR